MNKLIRILRDRRGESMVEILVSTVVFMLLLGALNGAVGFSANAQRKAEQIRQDAAQLQKSVRTTPPSGTGTTDTYAFHAIGADGSNEQTETTFRVTFNKETIPAKTEDNKTVNFYRFSPKEDSTP